MGTPEIYSTDEFYFATVLSAAIFLFACVGIALFITYRILKKYIDFGEIECSIHQYSANGIRYKVNTDNVVSDEKNEFFLLHGENPFEGIDHSIPEQLIRNGAKENGNQQTE